MKEEKLPPGEEAVVRDRCVGVKAAGFAATDSAFPPEHDGVRRVEGFPEVEALSVREGGVPCTVRELRQSGCDCTLLRTQRFEIF